MYMHLELISVIQDVNAIDTNVNTLNHTEDAGSGRRDKTTFLGE